MMNSTVGDEGGDFPPNPFRSAAPDPQQQQQQQQQQILSMYNQQPPQHQQQQQQQQSFIQDPVLSGTQFAPVPPAPTMQQPMVQPIQQQQPPPLPPQQTAPVQQQQQQQTPLAQQAPQTSYYGMCMSCINPDTYKSYFDIDTIDIKNRIKSAVTDFYKPDYFRNEIVGAASDGSQKKGTDLYGPLWITLTQIFILAVTSNVHAYLHSDDMEEFEYDIRHLLRASTVVFTLVLGMPFILWIGTHCLSMQNTLLLVDWICLYGYSLSAFIPATFLCLIPYEPFEWLVLCMATFVSVVLVIRNSASSLLSSDVSQTKSGPILMFILGCHIFFLLVVKIAFYEHHHGHHKTNSSGGGASNVIYTPSPTIVSTTLTPTIAPTVAGDGAQ